MRFKAEKYLTHRGAYWRLGDSARVGRLLQETRTSLDEFTEDMRRSRSDGRNDHRLLWAKDDVEHCDVEITDVSEEYTAKELEDEQDEIAEHADDEREEVAERTEGD